MPAHEFLFFCAVSGCVYFVIHIGPGMTGAADSLRLLLLGVFLGFLLIDLAFDMESIAGKFSTSSAFYLGRDEHDGLRRALLLQAPLLLCLALFGARCIRPRCWHDVLALLCVMCAMGGGSHVLSQRTLLSAVASDRPLERQELLTRIAWTHVAMLPLLLLAAAATQLAGTRGEAKKSRKSE